MKEAEKEYHLQQSGHNAFCGKNVLDKLTDKHWITDDWDIVTCKKCLNKMKNENILEKEMSKTLKPLSNKERAKLFAKVDSEGFGYYMLQYGPDLKAIERMGFDLKKVESAIEIMSEIESEIMRGEEFMEEFMEELE